MFKRSWYAWLWLFLFFCLVVFVFVVVVDFLLGFLSFTFLASPQSDLNHPPKLSRSLASFRLQIISKPLLDHISPFQHIHKITSVDLSQIMRDNNCRLVPAPRLERSKDERPGDRVKRRSRFV